LSSAYRYQGRMNVNENILVLSVLRKRPESPSGMTAGLRTTMSSWVMIVR
jgi:hypothetical protein